MLVSIRLLPFRTIINMEMGGWDLGHIEVMIITTRLDRTYLHFQAPSRQFYELPDDFASCQKREDCAHFLDGKNKAGAPCTALAAKLGG